MYNNLATEKKKNRNVFNFLFTRQKPNTESYFNEGKIMYCMNSLT